MASISAGDTPAGVGADVEDGVGRGVGASALGNGGTAGEGGAVLAVVPVAAEPAGPGARPAQYAKNPPATSRTTSVTVKTLNSTLRRRGPPTAGGKPGCCGYRAGGGPPGSYPLGP